MPRALLPLCALLAAGCPDKPAADDTETPAPPTPAALAAQVDPARYQSILEQVAVERPPGSAGWQAVQDLCATELAAAGFTVTREDYGSGVNVVGRKAGTSASPRTVVLSAHYDHITGCPGADDNGSGVAGLLAAAPVLGAAPFADDLVLACWDEEERGLIGSAAWATAAAVAGTAVEVSFVFEMIGYRSTEPGSQTLPTGFDSFFPEPYAAVEANESRGDFIALVADEDAAAAVAAMEAQAATDGLPTIPIVLTDEQTGSFLLQDLRRSDHDSFWEQGWPAIMITDTANFRNVAYHCDEAEDTVDRLDRDFAVAVVRSAVAAVATAAGE